ncbi:ligand-binding sensor domain-containing diguanylate cyclase [Frateuria defendens]|uniref:ligand-binding sensor domain-containing diguanylate cyclase n=1 Tax=Frateuria defendens TaxID=2219559 RepID=UPI001292DDD9|nr:ligand-binding sensor domain-containing diguanylate cyclase [Frateuria defendens]
MFRIPPPRMIRHAAGCLCLAAALLPGLPCAVAQEAAASPWSRWDNVNFAHLTVKEGLPHATTTAFAQDRSGLMWIGTFGGLVRYDGYRTQVFRQAAEPAAGLPDNYIRALQPAADGSLIVGTAGGGVARFDPWSNRFEHYDATPEHGTGPHIFALAPDHDGGFWIAGESGLSHLGADLKTLVRLPAGTGLPRRGDATLFSVLEDRRGDLWVGSGQGLYRRRHGAAAFEHVLPEDAQARIVLAEDIWAVRQDRAGNIWAGSGTDGVAVIDPRGRAHVPPGLGGDDPAVQHRTVRDLIEAPDGRIWGATDGVGVFVYDPRKGGIMPERHDMARDSSLGGNIVRALYLDRSAGLWAATEADASRCDTQPSIVHTLDGAAIFGGHGEVPDENVRSVYTDRRGTVWLGFNRGRVAAVEPQRGSIRTLVLGGGQQDQDVRSLDALDDGRIVVGSRGLVTVDPDTLAVRPYPVPDLDTRPVLALQAYRGGLLAGTYNGLYRIAPDGRVQHDRHAPGDPHSLVDNQVRNIAPMDNGDIWVATTGGISILRAGGRGYDNLFHLPDDPASLPQNYVGSIVAAGSRIWVGTYGGLASTPLEPGPSGYRFDTVRGSGGLGSDNIAAVLADRFGRLWTTTANGLAVYDPASRTAFALSERDGLSARFYNHRTAALGPVGELLFGGLSGLTVIEPAAAAGARASDAPLAVTAVYVDEKPIPFARLPAAETPLRVGENARSLRIGFALLDYAPGDDVRYSYQLEGFDEQWIDIEPGLPPTATYTRLPGGDYRLRLRARVPGLHARTVETGAPLSVALHWHEYAWVRVALILLLLGAVYLLVLLRTRYLHRRATQLSHLVHERTSELQAANERLNRLASLDELTGLLNRRELIRRLEFEYALAGRQDKPLSILMLDLDAFKALNDTHGHLAGDAALRTVAAVVAGYCRSEDHLGRYGGEEIMAVLPGADLDAARPIAERIRAAIAAAAIPFGEVRLQLTASIGVAALRPGERLQTLIARADAALYRAKRMGRNAVVVEAE